MRYGTSLLGLILVFLLLGVPLRAQLIPVLADAATGQRTALGGISFTDFRNSDTFQVSLRYTHPLTGGLDLMFDGGFLDQDENRFSDDDQAVYFGPGVRIKLASLADDQVLLSILGRALVYSSVFDFGLDVAALASVDLDFLTVYGGVAIQHEEFEKRGDDTLESGFIGISLPLQQESLRFLLEVSYLDFEDSRLAGGVSYRF